MQNMRLELAGGVHGEVTFKLDPPQPARNAVQPGECSKHNASTMWSTHMYRSATALCCVFLATLHCAVILLLVS